MLNDRVFTVLAVSALFGCTSGSPADSSRSPVSAPPDAASADASGPVSVPDNGKIGVLITDWGTPDGWDYDYHASIGVRSRYGERLTNPDEPCTEHFVGTFPYRSEIGLLPFAVTYPTVDADGTDWSFVYDSYGIYELDSERQLYVNIIDRSQTRVKAEVPAASVKPLKDSAKGQGRAGLGVDPRDGTDHLAGFFEIGGANGIADTQEVSLAATIKSSRLIYEDQTPRMNPMTVALEKQTVAYLEGMFGSQIDVRAGYYEVTKGLGKEPLSRREEDVALDFAKEGFKRLVLARETTDNNNYANKFMTRGLVDKALCRAGFDGKAPESSIDIKQVRQVGRTPEYNWMLMQTLKPHFASYKKGQEVTLIYATYGLPWTGADPAPAPFATTHPWAKEVYHENAYFNYLSFRSVAQEVYGKEFDLVFTHGGAESNLRSENFFAYTMKNSPLPNNFGHPDDELYFLGLREQIQKAKDDGRKEVVIVYSHWYYNNLDTLVAARILHDLPLNPKSEWEAGKFWIEWCEDHAADGTYTQKTHLNGKLNPDGSCADPNDTHIRLTEAFDIVIDGFSRNYAGRIRGGIERYGVMPSKLDVKVEAKGAIDYEAGGKVTVEAGPLAGATLVVARDPQPNAPESYEWSDLYRPAAETNRVGDSVANVKGTVRGFNDPTQPLVSAWDSFEAYIGQQAKADPDTALPVLENAIGPAVLFGPYRTLFNKPAVITLPFNAERLGGKTVRAYVFNDITYAWDKVHPVVGGPELTVDTTAQRASVAVQVLGIYALGAE